MTQKIEKLYFRDFCDGSNIPLTIQLREYPESSDQWHSHQDFAELVVITHGTGTNEMPGGAARLQAGDVIIFAPGSCHRYINMRAMQHFTLLFDPAMLNMSPRFSELFAGSSKLYRSNGNISDVLHFNEKELYTALLLLENIRHEQINFSIGYQEAMFADFCRLLIHILRHASAHAGRAGNTAFKIAQCIRYMEQHAEESLTLQKLSSYVHMSESSFRNHFRAQTNLPPLDYLIRVRLRRAALLLFYSDRQITQIALESGFTDGNYFARKFRHFFRITPREFRNQCLSGQLKLSNELKKLQLLDDN